MNEGIAGGPVGGGAAPVSGPVMEAAPSVVSPSSSAPVAEGGTGGGIGASIVEAMSAPQVSTPEEAGAPDTFIDQLDTMSSPDEVLDALAQGAVSETPSSTGVESGKEIVPHAGVFGDPGVEILTDKQVADQIEKHEADEAARVAPRIEPLSTPAMPATEQSAGSVGTPPLPGTSSPEVLTSVPVEEPTTPPVEPPVPPADTEATLNAPLPVSPEPAAPTPEAPTPEAAPPQPTVEELAAAAAEAKRVQAEKDAQEYIDAYLKKNPNLDTLTPEDRKKILDDLGQILMDQPETVKETLEKAEALRARYKAVPEGSETAQQDKAAVVAEWHSYIGNLQMLVRQKLQAYDADTIAHAVATVGELEKILLDEAFSKIVKGEAGSAKIKNVLLMLIGLLVIGAIKQGTSPDILK